MGRKKEYTARTLRAAVDAYFDSITREITIKERVNTGKKDNYGHIVYEERPVVNNLGKEATRTEYLVPPTIGGLCIHLGIVGSTWSRWRDKKLMRVLKMRKMLALR